MKVDNKEKIYVARIKKSLYFKFCKVATITYFNKLPNLVKTPETTLKNVKEDLLVGSLNLTEPSHSV